MTTVTANFDLTPFIATLAREASPERLANIAGRAVADVVRQSLRNYGATHPNKLGGATTNFYGRAADGTTMQVSGNVATIEIHQIGINQRIYGGEIVPRKGRYLAIPVSAQSHGRQPRDMALVPVIRHVNGKPRLVALADPTTGKRMFAMAESVRQVGDPTIIPEEKLKAAADEAVAKTLSALT